MARIIKLPTFNDFRGDLTVMEKLLPFEIKRFFFVYNVRETRGKHGHKKAKQAFICLGGKCEVYLKNKNIEEKFILEKPYQCLLVDPGTWHTMDNFSDGAVLLVLSSDYYDQNDYFFEKP